MSSSDFPALLALERLWHWERATPDRVAFTQPMGGGAVRVYTWQQAAEEARRMAAFLQQQGVAPGDRVAILSKNCFWWILSDLAIWMAGGVSVPLYPTLAASTVAQLLAHSAARVLFVGKLDDWETMRSGVPAALQRISYPLSPPDVLAPADLSWDAIVARTPALAGHPTRGAQELASIIYTSGTTGAPKGVMQTFGAFAWAIAAGLKRVQLDKDARMLSYLPLAHVAERMLVEHGQLATGFEVYFAESLETFAQDLRRARPTVFFSVPRLWLKFQQGIHARVPPRRLERLLRVPLLGRIVRRRILQALGLEACRYAAVGGAPMPPELVRWYRRLGLDIVDVYGMTENCAVSHATLPDRPRPRSVGVPFDGVRARIDPASGEIQLHSGCLTQGYYREPELTAAAFCADGWLRTGDRGVIEADGGLRITGRLKDQFKTSKGKYIAPAPIEDLLVEHPAIEACCIVGANLPQPFALVMLNAEAAAQAGRPSSRATLAAALDAHLQAVNRVLDPHERLRLLVLMTQPWTVDNGLVTPTFKVKRGEIEARFGPRFETWAADAARVAWA